MKKIITLGLLCLVIVFGCKTDADTVQDVAADDEAALVSEMETYLNNAFEKMDQMAVSEGLNQFVAVLAIKDKLKKPSVKAEELVKSAETELTKIASGLRLFPGPDWLDENDNQITGSTMELGKEKALNPEVLLVYNVGGEIAVTGAPVEFSFIKGGGLLDKTVTTNDYGQALSLIAKVNDVKQEVVVRATVTVTVKGYTYRFENVTRDFIFVPPSRRATIIVYESAPDFISDHPFIFDTAYKTLKNIDFDFTQYNGVLMGKEFLKVFGGDIGAIKKLALEQGVPYLVMVYNDCYRLNKAHADFEIYISEVKATLRIIRVADGKILFETVAYADKAHDNPGQGSSMEKARNNGFQKAAKELESDLKKKFKQINEALLGK
ncbi:MAG: hypothetical protein JW822_04665 [Spirochaetales bacterium]|nr:hypothetical protein [Spirochaetales bacterium]